MIRVISRLFCGALIVLSGVGYSVFGYAQTVQPAPNGSHAAQETAQLDQSAIPTLKAPALIVALDRTTLSSEITATVAALPKRPGEAFDKGDELVRFSCATYEAQRDVARAEIKATDAELQVKRRLFDLQSIGAIEVEVAEANLQRAKAQTRLYQEQVNRCSIKAPYPGRVVEWVARPYASVDLGGKLLEIVGDEQLEVEVIIPSSWLRWLKEELSFTFAANETGKNVIATVDRLGAVIDPASQTMVIRARINDSQLHELVPGMSGRAVFPMNDGS